MYSAWQARLILITQLRNFAKNGVGIFRFNNKNMVIEMEPLLDKLLNHELSSAKTILESYAFVLDCNLETIKETRAGQEPFWKNVKEIYDKVLPQIELNTIRHHSERKKFGNFIAEIKAQESKELKVGNF